MPRRAVAENLRALTPAACTALVPLPSLSIATVDGAELRRRATVRLAEQALFTLLFAGFSVMAAGFLLRL